MTDEENDDTCDCAACQIRRGLQDGDSPVTVLSVTREDMVALSQRWVPEDVLLRVPLQVITLLLGNSIARA